MNTLYAHGAAPGTCSALKRRLTPLLVLVCSLLCFTAGDLFLPDAALANQAKVSRTASPKTAATKTPVKKAASANKKTRRPLYIRSLTPETEQTALKERGISSGFGNRAISKKRTRLHKGIDVPAPKDSKIVAFNDGEVIFSGRKNGYGTAVIIRQIDGREALYAHMNKAVVSVGDTVRRGDHIGHVGRTGRATGYHLHFEIIDDGENLDPALHVWLGSELVLGPGDLDPAVEGQTRVASPNGRTSIPLY